MASLQISGFDEYVRQLAKLEQDADKIMRKAVRENAGIVADEIRKEIEQIPLHSKGYRGGIRQYERAALLQGLGISPINVFDDDFLNASVGFDGYFDADRGDFLGIGSNDDRDYWVSERTVENKPIPMIARSIAGGTSFSEKYPFVRIAVGNVRNRVKWNMQKVFDEEVKKTMNKK